MSVSMCLEHVVDKNNCFSCLEWTGPGRGVSVSVATERHVITLLLAAILILNLSLKNGYEAFAMAQCLSHSNKCSRPDHVRLL
jgi:hypothetical protein